MTIRFTDTAIKDLRCPAGKKDRFFFDTEVKGLALRVTNKGNKIFQLRWTDKLTGKKRNLPLDDYGSITLKAARDAARIRLGEVAKGKDPIADMEEAAIIADERQQELKLKLETLIDEWQEMHLSQCSPRYRKEAVRVLKKGFEDHLKRPAMRLSKKDVVDTLDDVARHNGKTIAARMCSYGRAMYQWALERDKVKENPFENLPFNAVKSERDRVLTDDELGKIYKAAGTISYPYGPYHQMVALTGQRVNEVAGMKWDEIAKDFDIWTIPPERAKNGEAHIVHLSKPAQDILKKLKEGKNSSFVFTTTSETSISGFSTAKKRLDKKSGVQNWVEHDWRRTVVTTLAKKGIDHVVADKLLNHREGKINGVARVYQRHDFMDKRKEALDMWAEHIASHAKKAKLPELDGMKEKVSDKKQKNTKAVKKAKADKVGG